MEKVENTKLTSKVTVKEYRKFKEDQDCNAIADLIFDRFFERYLEPFKNNPARHGFSMMAVGCLMTESLYCFKKGRKQVGEAGGVAFENFFSESVEFEAFRGYGEEFYRNVRCGILHQGETYGGWRIRRTGDIFQEAAKAINATRYLSAMELSLRAFIANLKNTPFNSNTWKRVIKKLDHICENCNA